jgi:hypothetical protein
MIEVMLMISEYIMLRRPFENDYNRCDATLFLGRSS